MTFFELLMGALVGFIFYVVVAAIYIFLLPDIIRIVKKVSRGWNA